MAVAQTTATTNARWSLLGRRTAATVTLGLVQEAVIAILVGAAGFAVEVLHASTSASSLSGQSSPARNTRHGFIGSCPSAAARIQPSRPMSPSPGGRLETVVRGARTPPGTGRSPGEGTRTNRPAGPG